MPLNALFNVVPTPAVVAALSLAEVALVPVDLIAAFSFALSAALYLL